MVECGRIERHFGLYPARFPGPSGHATSPHCLSGWAGGFSGFSVILAVCIPPTLCRPLRPRPIRVV